MSANSFEDLDGFNAAMEANGIRYRLRRDKWGFHTLVVPGPEGDQPTGFGSECHTPIEVVLEVAMIFTSGAIAGSRLSPIVQG